MMDCNNVDNSETQNMHCKYADVWEAEFECGSMVVTPSSSLKKLLDHSKLLIGPDAEFTGSKKWCEEQKARLRSRLIPLVAAGNEIIGTADTEGKPKDLSLEKLVAAYQYNHYSIFRDIYFHRAKSASVRD